MKASGNYNAVTQEAGGSYEVDRSDYRETRTNWLLIFGAIIAVLLVAYFLFKDALGSITTAVSSAIGNPIADVTDAAGQAAQNAVNTVKQQNQNSIDTVVRAAGAQQGPAATSDYWNAVDRYLGESAISTTAISAGNVILSTPIINNLGQPLLAQATIAGQNFQQELDANGDTTRLQNDPLKSVIISGEAISKTFTGIDPYEAGKSFGGWIRGIGG
jgi:hypothetical protein